MQEEVESNSKYVLSVKTQTCMYRDSFPNKGSQNNANVENCKTVKLPLPPITLESFENNSSDPFAYFTFKKTFLNALAGIPSLTNAQKLIYLKNFVKGETLNTIENVTLNDEGFETAFDLLDFNFSNKEEIRDRTLEAILSLSEAKSLKEVESLIRAVNSKLHDLKSLNLDLLESDSVGLVLVSKIICNKLPRHFLIELFRETSTNYPSFNQLLQVYQNILTRLKVSCKDNGSKAKDGNDKGAKPKMLNASSNNLDNKPGEAKSLADKKGWCTKCLSGKHLLDSCPGKSASLPFKCYKCKKAEHHAVVCPTTKNFASKSNSKDSFNYQSNSGVMNPVLSFTVSRGKSRAKFVFLLDSGAQFSSICKEAVEKYVDECRSPPMARFVCSFGQNKGRWTKGYNYTAKLTLPCGQKIDVDFFAVENLSFQLTFPTLNNIVDNIRADSIPLHSDYPYQGGETVEVLGILGIDVLQYIKPYSHEELCVHGKRANFIKLPNGYIPFGSAELFLYPGESKFPRQRLLEKFVPWEDGSSSTVEIKNKKRRKVKRTAVSDAVSNEDVHVKNVKKNLSDVKRQNLEFKPPQRVVGVCKYLVNCALEPSASQFDPLKEVFPCADVEYGLDNFYNLESIGVDNFNISLAPRERDSILTNKQQKCAIAMLCTAMSLF